MTESETGLGRSVGADTTSKHVGPDFGCQWFCTFRKIENDDEVVGSLTDGACRKN